jgi:hypothetical protein
LEEVTNYSPAYAERETEPTMMFVHKHSLVPASEEKPQPSPPNWESQVNDNSISWVSASAGGHYSTSTENPFSFIRSWSGSVLEW